MTNVILVQKSRCEKPQSHLKASVFSMNRLGRCPSFFWKMPKNLLKNHINTITLGYVLGKNKMNLSKKLYI